MKIIVIGAGPIGANFAAFSALAGHEVYVVAHRQVSADAINAAGGIHMDVCPAFGADPVPYFGKLSASTSTEGLPLADVVAISTKAFQLREAAENASNVIGPDTVVLSLQNGLGNAEIIDELYPGHSAYSALVCSGMRGKDEAGFTITMYPDRIHVTTTSAYAPMAEKLKALEASLAESRMHFRVEEKAEMDKQLWKKVCLNIVINPLGALHEGPQDATFGTPEGIELAEHLIAEALSVAKAEGVELSREEVVLVPQKARPKVTEGYRHFTSMAMDVIRRKPVEIDYLNGAIVRLGRKHGIPTPYNECICLLMKLVVSTYEDRYEVIKN